MSAIVEMEGLVKQIGGREWGYAWLPTAAVQALVAWLAATLYRPHGKFKQALAHLTHAQQVIDEELRRQGIQVRLAAPMVLLWQYNAPLCTWQCRLTHAVHTLSCIM